MSRLVSERSAGGVVLMRHGPQLMVPLIRLRRGAVHALPKGHIEPGEDPPETAVREVREETGVSARVLATLPEISYVFWSRSLGARVAKRVAFFLLEYRAGSTAHHDAEVEGVRLVPLDEAVAALTYPGERGVMEAALAWVGAEGYGATGAKGPPGP